MFSRPEIYILKPLQLGPETEICSKYYGGYRTFVLTNPLAVFS